MKRTLNLFAVLIFIFFAYSCSNDGKDISEIKLIPVKNGSDYQYVDQQGKIVINPQFSEATIFRNGLALVRTTGEEPKWGFIAEDGKYVINANYKAATVFNEDLAWVVSSNGAPTAINTKGEVKFTLQEAEEVRVFEEGLAPFSVIDTSGEKWGFVNTTGKVVINPQFSNTGRFSQGKCAVENNDGKWGFIDNSGKIVINHQFTKTGERFIQNRAVVFLEEKAGVIDDAGKFVINPQFSKMISDGENYLIQQDGKWGWCDKEGKIIINPQFGEAFPFMGKDLAPVQSGKSWGFVDKEGKIVVNPQFDFALPFNGKSALVVSSSKVGFIDVEGKYIINPQFDDVSRDIASYLLNGGSEYSSLVTDFFNLNSIVNRININNPEGLTFNSKLSDVVSKFRKTESDFNQYSTDHLIVSNERITNDASYSFYVIANAYKEIPDGWYTQRVFNSDAEVQGFGYTLSLSGKGIGKETEVKDAIEKSFKGYVKDEYQSSELISVFKNNDKVIKSYIYGGQIFVVFTRNQNENLQAEEYGD
jgi:hypothetical protein